MDNNITKTEFQETEENLEEKVANLAMYFLTTERKSRQETVEALVTNLGISEELANETVNAGANAYNEARENQMKEARKFIIYGILWFAGGLGLTLANFGYIFYGAIVFGLWDVVRGIYYCVKVNNEFPKIN